ncbi:MAG: tetratricopeptide repeat protein, partial [Firmicutes bacterium]|nr:tetratricopeptide repeat protein [Bacillota bacterium]
MKAQKRIQIFLASAIEELKLERAEVLGLFDWLNRIHSDKGIFFDLIRCDDQHDFMVREKAQNRYDEQIRNSMLVIFVVGKKYGAGTKHELKVAYKKYLENHKKYKEKATPKILTYAKRNNNDKIESTDFLNDLQANYKNHYTATYNSIESLLYNLLRNLMNLDVEGIDLRYSNEALWSGSEQILELKNIQEWRNNDVLKSAQSEFDNLEKEYFKLQIEYNKEDCDDDTNQKYREVAGQYKKDKQALKQLKVQIFNDLKTLAKVSLEQGLSNRLQIAYSMMEEGSYIEAKKNLPLDGILEAIAQDDASETETYELENIIDSRKEQAKLNHTNRLNELLAGIKVNRTLAKNQTDWLEIEEYYKIAIEYVKKHKNLPKDVYFEYAYFLDKQNKHTEAIKYYELYLPIVKDLAKANPDAYLPDVAGTLNNLGGLQGTTNKHDDAEASFNEALEIRRNLAKVNPNAYLPDV